MTTGEVTKEWEKEKGMGHIWNIINGHDILIFFLLWALKLPQESSKWPLNATMKIHNETSLSDWSGTKVLLFNIPPPLRYLHIWKRIHHPLVIVTFFSNLISTECYNLENCNHNSCCVSPVFPSWLNSLLTVCSLFMKRLFVFVYLLGSIKTT